MRHAYRKLRLAAAHRFSRIEVPNSPHFDDESGAFFEARISEVSRYLEYGSGGSTVLAHKYVKCLVSVESDRRFLRAVQRMLDANPSQAEAILIPVNIGLTEAWGRPAFTKPTPRRLRRWQAYPRAPWVYYKYRKQEPDLILVDGRFRVACVLESLLNQGENRSCQILLDDYLGRSHYSVVEEFADLLEMKGRMAVLRAKPGLDRGNCQRVLEHYYSDFR